jgi:hypothetical protein
VKPSAVGITELGQVMALKWSEGWHTCFVFRMSQFKILSPELDCHDRHFVFRGFPQSVHENSRKVPQNRPRPFPSAFFPIHFSSIILTFDAMQYGVLAASLNNPFIFVHIEQCAGLFAWKVKGKTRQSYPCNRP